MRMYLQNSVSGVVMYIPLKVFLNFGNFSASVTMADADQLLSYHMLPLRRRPQTSHTPLSIPRVSKR